MKYLFILVLFTVAKVHAQGKIINSLTTKNVAPPVIKAATNSGDAVEIVMHFLNEYASMRCSNDLGVSLNPQLENARTKFSKIYKKGTKKDVIVLTNKNTCQVIGIIEKGGIVRKKENVCSVDDIIARDESLIFDPEVTGFFTISLSL